MTCISSHRQLGGTRTALRAANVSSSEPRGDDDAMLSDNLEFRSRLYLPIAFPLLPVS